VAFEGCTLLPGLVDSHTHLTFRGDGSLLEPAMEDPDELLMLYGARNARLALASGVTTMRDNGGRGKTALMLREGIRRGLVPGPRLLVAGRPLTIPRGHCWPLGGEAAGAETLRARVRELVAEGVDWIKIMATGGGTVGTKPHEPAYSTEELSAIAGEAHAHGRPVGAHSTCSEATRRLLDAGVDMIIHGNFRDADGTYRFDDDLAARMAGSGTWFNPTLHVCRSRIWYLEALSRTRRLTEEEATYLAGQAESWEELVDLVQRLMQAGVRLVAGSDSGWSRYAFGGFRHEIQALTEAGMSNSEALAAATRLSAEALGLGAEVGTLERGKAADLLVVRGNPLEDVGALGQVAAVFLGGVRFGEDRRSSERPPGLSAP
jgi:imidazolonepropionase-like amidohydrolase